MHLIRCFSSLTPATSQPVFRAKPGLDFFAISSFRRTILILGIFFYSVPLFSAPIPGFLPPPISPRTLGPNTDIFGTHHVGHVLDPEHFCGTDFNSPASKAALAKYAADRAAGLYPIAPKNSKIPEVGDELPFRVSENNDWISINFRLVDKTSLYHLWVEIAEINNGNVNSTVIANLRQVAINSSPSRSINPSKGFFANNHDVYGQPPNVDGDGIVDLLMYDIGRGTGATLGYVSPQDLVINPTDGTGNGRDILYLDSDQGTRNLTTLAAIAAHEYTHLIHQAYGSDETFLSEGYAEFAIDFNGYYWRPTTYPATVSEVTQSLFNWRTGGGPGALDYERAGLFVTYLASRVGPHIVGDMLRSVKLKSARGIDSVLTVHGSRLADVIRDFHTANFFNDRTLDPRFGFVQPERSAHKTPLTNAPINGEVMSNGGDGGGEGGFEDAFFESINSGAVRYRRYNSVANFNYTYDVPIDPIFGNATQLLARVRNSARIAVKRMNSNTIEFSEIQPSDEMRTIGGKFDWILFIFVHNNPGKATGDRTEMKADWTPVSMVTSNESTPEAPQDWMLGLNYPNPFNPQTTIPIHLGAPSTISLEVFDALGRSQAVLAQGMFSTGLHTFNLDASGWSSGAYLVRLTTPNGIQTRLMTLLK